MPNRLLSLHHNHRLLHHDLAVYAGHPNAMNQRPASGLINYSPFTYVP